MHTPMPILISFFRPLNPVLVLFFFSLHVSLLLSLCFPFFSFYFFGPSSL
jgi:hypothetical protein